MEARGCVPGASRPLVLLPLNHPWTSSSPRSDVGTVPMLQSTFGPRTMANDTHSVSFVNSSLPFVADIDRMCSLEYDPADMLALERRRLIAESIRARGAVSVAEMAQTLGTTEITLRRDLRSMAKDGLLVRTHGGAVLPEIGRASCRERVVV